jgi:histidyl-tRNA synthetase
MAKKEKSFRPKARIPRGFRDRLGAEIAAERDMLAKISAVYEAWGFDPLETPAFEYTDALGKFLPDVDRPGQGVFSLQDDDEQWMSLRYDLTAPLARFVAQNYDALPKPFRRYAVGPVWRNEKPGPGRFRQFTQCDADSVGAPTPFADAEMCMLFADVMEAAGLARGDYVIRVNNRKVLDGVLEVIGLAGGENAERRLTVLRAIDKLDKFGPEGVRQLLGKGRMDESGDFTEGAKLAPDQISKMMVLFDIDQMAANARASNPAYQAGMASGKIDTRQAEEIRARGIFGGLDVNISRSSRGREGATELQQIWEQVRELGYDDGRVRIDPSVVRGLDYYTGPVFEAELTFEVKDEKGQPVRFGSVGGGGRYDDLVKRFKGVEVPAVGISVGVSRLLSALELKKSGETQARGPVVVLALEKDQMAAYQQMAAELRASGVRAEVYLGSANFAKQLKYADKRMAPAAVIQGEDERGKGEVTIKDLVLGAALSKEIEDNAEWREGQPAQFSVARDKLVEAVKETLARKR